MRERSSVEAQLYQVTKHLMDVSVDTVERVVAGEPVVPTHHGPTIDVAFPTAAANDL